MNFHGVEIHDLEQNWTEYHLLRISHYSQICDKETMTWQDYFDKLDIQITSDMPPLDVEFNMVMSGGGAFRFISFHLISFRFEIAVECDVLNKCL